MATGTEIWGSFELSEHTPTVWQAGHLTCRYKAEDRQIDLVYSHNIEIFESLNLDDTNSDIIRERWTLPQEPKRIRLSPVFPDRSLVVKPEVNFRLSKNTSARVFIRVPIWVRVEIEIGTESLFLTDIPLIILTSTWSGTFMDGELCYAITSGVKASTSPDPSRPYLAICPLDIANRSDEDLIVEKINLDVGSFSLFIHQEQLWSDDAQITYMGENEISEIKVNGNPPTEATSSELITEPRNPFMKSFSARTFATLKDFAGLGYR